MSSRLFKIKNPPTPVHVRAIPVHVRATPVHVRATPVHVRATPVHVGATMSLARTPETRLFEWFVIIAQIPAWDIAVQVHSVPISTKLLAVLIQLQAPQIYHNL